MLSEVKNIFNVNESHETNSREMENDLARIYCLLGSFLTPLFTIVTLNRQDSLDIICLALISLLFLSGFVFSGKNFPITRVKNNLSDLSLWIYLLTSAYAIFATYERHFSVDYSFGLTLLFFVFGFMLKDVRQVIVYFLVTAFIGVIALAAVKSPQISLPFLVSFFLIFFCTGFFAIRYKAIMRNRMEQRESFLKTIFNQAHDSILMVDFYSGVVVDCNDAAVSLFEVLDKNEIIGFRRDRFEENKMNEKELIAARRDLARNGIWKSETSFVTKKGRQFWGDVVITPLTIGNTQYYVARIYDISSQIIAKEALRENEERYRNIFKSNPQPVWIYDINTLKFIDVNDEAVRQYGYSYSEFLNMTLLDIRPEEEKARLIEHVKNSSQDENVNNKITHTGDWKHRKKDGTVIDVEIVRTKISFRGREANMALVKDVTEIRKAEKALRESEERFKRLSDITSEAIAIHDKGKILEVNKGFVKLFGYNENETIGMSAAQLAAPESIDLVMANILSRNENPYEVVGIRKDGSKFMAEVTGKTIVFKDREARVTVMRDITAYKTAEKLLVESEKKYRTLIENMPKEYFFFSYNGEGKLLFLSPTFSGILGHDPNEFMSNYASFVTHNPQNPDVQKHIQAANEGKLHQPFKVEIFRKNGTKCWLEVIETPVLDEKGKVIAVEGLARDITESLMAEEMLRESQERLSNFMNSATEMFALFDENFILLEINKAGMDLLGKKREELLGKNIKELAPDVELSGRLAKYKEVLLTGKPCHIEDYVFKTNSTESILITNAFKVGHGIGIVSVDITTRKKAEDQILESEKNYKNLVESSPDGILIIVDEKIEFANPMALSLLGYKSIGQLNSLNTVLMPEFIKLSEERRGLAMKGNDVPFAEIKVKRSTGEVLEVDSKQIGITYKGKKAVLVVLHDLSQVKQLSREKLRAEIAEETAQQLKREVAERLKVEKLLVESQKYTSKLIESSLDMICASDTEGIITEFNSAGLKSFGYAPQEIIGKHFSMLYANPGHQEKVNKELLGKEGSFRGEITNIRKNGEVFISFLSASVLLDEEGKVFGFMGVSRDVTEFKKAEIELKESEEKYRDLFENASDLIQSVDPAGNILYVNKSWLSTLGYTLEELKDLKIFDFLHPDGMEHCLALFEKIFMGVKVPEVEIIYKTKNGKKVIASGKVSVKAVDGKIVSTRGIFRDVTESKKAQELIIKSLQEKEVLLKEVHHRVKNNMQVISSILNLQSEYVKDKKTLEILRESQNRIKTMAYIHESLYHTSDFSKIDFSEYILNLSNNLASSYEIFAPGTNNPEEKNGSFSVHATLETEVEKEVYLNINKAIPVGLIINELISNAFKHAFPDGKTGLVILKLKKIKEFLYLEVADNGIGIPRKINFQNSKSLGFQLVSTLAEQIGGTVKIENKNGTRILVNFDEK